MLFKFGLFLLAAQAIPSVFASPVDFSPNPRSVLVPRAPSSFVHPGVFLGKKQLDFIAGKVKAGEQPWKGAFDSMLADKLGSLSREPSPTGTVECGPTSKPDIGCSQERQDALAAYAMSLAWYITRSKQYATKAISYMNAWAKTIKKHTNSNGPLQTGWAGSSWARAAEIIRYSDAGWADSDISAFEDMLRNAYLPGIIGGSNSNGNWELVMMEAAIGISVFLNDAGSYDKAMEKYMGRVPAYIYLTSDGKLPKAAPGSGLSGNAIVDYWQGQSKFEDGICQETCRDFVHTGYGISSVGNVAETSRIQGTDLYSTDIGTRLRQALGFHSKYELGAAVPSWLCNGSIKKGLGPVTEVGFNAMSTRLGNPMPTTETLTNNNRPAGTNLLFVGWETLTNAGTP